MHQLFEDTMQKKCQVALLKAKACPRKLEFTNLEKLNVDLTGVAPGQYRMCWCPPSGTQAPLPLK